MILTVYEIYTFQNVRFGAATNGSYRFKASDYPSIRSSDKTIESGDSCPQGGEDVNVTTLLY